MTAEERALRAGELALGVLEGEERAEALRLILADPAFARDVEQWRDRFALWFADWPKTTPDPALEGRIMAALPGAAAGGPQDTAMNDNALDVVRRWRVIAGSASAVAAVLFAALLLQPERATSPSARPDALATNPTPLVAVLTFTGPGEPVAAVVDRRTGEVTLAGALDVPAGRVAQLWTIGTDATPRSVGLLSSSSTPRLGIRPEGRARLAPGVTLAVSIEPPGGSPRSTPTGPVIATGLLRSV